MCALFNVPQVTTLEIILVIEYYKNNFERKIFELMIEVMEVIY